MATDIVVSQRVGLPAAAEAQRMWQLAGQVQHTDLVPSDFRGKPEAVLACALAGRELGLGFFESMRSFYIVDGKPSESAELLHTLALRAGHDIWVESATNSGAVVRGRHRDWPADRPEAVVEWTVEDAAQAELVDWECLDTWPRHNRRDIVKHKRDGGTYTKKDTCECKDNWRKYGRAMFRSRGITEMVRMLCPEVTVGATYTPEELGAAVSGPGGVPDGAVAGWGASGENFVLPAPADIDAMWVAKHSPDQVLAMVDHHGADLIVPEAGDVTLVDWVRRCERSGEKRRHLLDALAVRAGEDVTPPDDDEDEEQDDVEDAVCGDCGGPAGAGHDCAEHRAAQAEQARATLETDQDSSDPAGAGVDEPAGEVEPGQAVQADREAPSPADLTGTWICDTCDKVVKAGEDHVHELSDPDAADRRPIQERAKSLGLGMVEVANTAAELGYDRPSRWRDVGPAADPDLLDGLHGWLDVEAATGERGAA